MAEAAGEINGYWKPELDGQGVTNMEKAGVELDSIHVAELDSQQICGKAIFSSASKADKNNIIVEETPMAELSAGRPVGGDIGVEAQEEPKGN